MVSRRVASLRTLMVESDPGGASLQSPESVERQRIIDWFRSAIREFRSAANGLDENERLRLQLSSSFLAPFQATVFWSKDPEFQLIIFTHLEDWKDGDVQICGPVHSRELVHAADVFLRDGRWARRLPEDHVSVIAQDPLFQAETIGDLVANALLQFARGFERAHLLNLPRPSPLMGYLIFENAWAQEYAGSIADTPRDQLISSAIAEARRIAARASTSSPPSPGTIVQRPRGEAAHYSIIFPPIAIGGVPRPKGPEERWTRQYLKPLLDNSIDITLGNSRLVVRRDGLIVTFQGDRQEATRLLNLVAAIANHRGLSCAAFREVDVCPVEFQLGTMTPMGWNELRPPRSDMVGNSLFHGFLPPEVKRTEVPLTTMTSALKLVAQVLADASAIEDLLLDIEAKTHLDSFDFSSSFTLSWIIIERSLVYTWETFLERSRPEGVTVRGALSKDWNVDRVAKALRFAGQIDESYFEQIMRLKDRRNDLLHGKKPTNPEDAHECYRLAYELAEGYLEDLEMETVTKSVPATEKEMVRLSPSIERRDHRDNQGA